MASLFDNIDELVMSPMFLGGMNLALGGGPQGMMQGMNMGSQAKRQRQRDTSFQSFLQDPEAQKALGPVMPVLRAGGSEMLPFAGQYLSKQPELAMDREKHNLGLQLTKAQIDLLKSKASLANVRADLAPDHAAMRRQEVLRMYDRDENGNVRRRDPLTINRVHGSIEQKPSDTSTEPAQPYRDWSMSMPDSQFVGQTDARKRPIAPQSVRDNTLTDDEIQEYYDAKFPDARSKGHVWRRDGTLQSLTMTKDERLAHGLAQDAITELQIARKKLERAGTVGQAMGTSVNVPYFGEKRPFENLTQGGQDAGIGFRAFAASMNDLLFSLSGKQVTDKERAHYMELYGPKFTDHADLQQWKFDRVERFFARVMAARKTGATDDDIAAMLKTELRNTSGGQSQRANSNARPRSGWSIERAD